MTRMTFRTLVLTAIALAAAICMHAHAGAPLQCHKFQIGDAKCLPWGSDAFDRSKSYDTARVVDDTLALLDAGTPVLVRMETIRRATIYIGGDGAQADRLLGSLLTRALDAEVEMNEKTLALRYFDAGYLAATFQQAGVETSFGPTNGQHELHRVAGYAWMVRGYKMTDLDGDFALALALATADTRLTEHTMFLERAVKTAAADDSARNDLLGWICQIRGTTVDAVRAQFSSQATARP